ncbi:MAG: hypothetical protein H7242_01590 [Microbacteriaceae bacterium]|nr:hypothetical protein [Burkholderiaceae bacterium]
MNLADRLNVQATRAAARPAGDPTPMDAPSMAEVVARIAAEVSGPLTAALDRVVSLAASGHIDRAGLQSLRDEIDGARQAGLRGQQIARFSEAPMQQIVERIDLSLLLRNVLKAQAMRACAGALGSGQTLGAAEVMGDLSLVHAVLQAVVDWSAELTLSRVDWRLDLQPWPVRARLQCRFAHRAADLVSSETAESAESAEGAVGARLTQLDTLEWLLLQYTAHRAGVIVRRDDGPSHTTLVLEFTHTVNDTLEGASAVDLAESGAATTLMAGSQVLVLAARRDARSQVRAAMHGHELVVDYVPSVAAARQYCEDGIPQVLLFESSFNGDALRMLCDRLEDLAPGMAFIEIVPTGHGCEMGGSSGHRITRVGSDGLRHVLASVMLLELARRR